MTDATFASYRDLFDLTGKTALVTGGTGILGREFCRGLADMGAVVAVTDLKADNAETLARSLPVPQHQRHCGFGCDLRDPAAIAELVEKVIAETGGIDILHNNAAASAVAEGNEPLETYAIATWREIMAINIEAMFLLARMVGGHMIASGRRGSIVQMSSIYGVMAPDFRIYEDSSYDGRAIRSPAVYTASKAAVIGLTKYLASYWGAQGIRVNAICPGGVESGQNDVFKARYGARVPLDRMARREEIVGALLFLASSASSYVTGQTLMIDGGLSSW